MLGAPTLALKPSSFPCPKFGNRTMTVRASSGYNVAQLTALAAAQDRKSLYEVLRVKQNASPGEIKTAYRTLAKLYHPDATSRFMNSSVVSTSDGQDFIEIRDAYVTLSDPNARAVYDLKLNVNNQRRWNSSGLSAYPPGRGRYYQSRRWETDQCW